MSWQSGAVSTLRGVVPKSGTGSSRLFPTLASLKHGMPSQWAALCSTSTSSSTGTTSKQRALEHREGKLHRDAFHRRVKHHHSALIQRRRHYSEQPPRTLACPSCSAPLPAPVTEASTTSRSSAPAPLILSHCPACNAFLPPSEDVDYFKLFSLPPGFGVDKGVLRRSFLQWQGLVHPDKLPQAVDSSHRRQQEDWANLWSSIVNEGYKTLSDERLRGEYILGKQGVAVTEEDKMDDPELLMEIMEVREALEDAQTQDEVDAIRESNRDKTKQTLSELEHLLQGKADGETAKNLLIKLRYMNNVEGVCKEWQPGKEIVLQH